ncbi:MAG: carboxypeptidase regulatory-like domain-containing protein [Gemmatimonadales bacterium]
MAAGGTTAGVLLLVGLVAVMCPASVRAQSPTTGILQGRVSDHAGQPVVRADVLAAHEDGVTRRETTSDSRGAFRLAFLPPGAYRVTVRRIGYRPLIVDQVTLRAGRAEALAVSLEPSANTLDSIVVRAPAVRINTTDTESGTRLTSRELVVLPLPNDVHNLVAFTPGARPDQIWGAANAQANNYQLDGVSVNHPGLGADFLQLPPSWIEEVEVKGLGAGAEYGNFQGGLVNLVTKSGTSRVEGFFRTNGESWHLNGTNLRVSEAGSEPSHRAELDVQVRGPLARERLQFALFGNLVDRGSRVLNRVRQVSGDFAPEGPDERELKLLGKLSWQPSSSGRDIVTGTLGRVDLTGERFGLNGFQSAEATQRRRAATTLYNLAWQRIWSPRNFLELKLAGFTGSDRRDPYAGDSIPGIQTQLEVNPREYQNAAFRERREPASLALALNWDVYVRTAGIEHHLKLGGEQGFGSWLFQGFRNGGLTWRPGERLVPPGFEPTDPATWVFSGVITSSWGGEVNLDSKVENSAIFAQDYIQLGRRFALTPGLRFGRWVGKLRKADGSGYFTPITTTGWDPRIGAVVDLDGHGTLVAKAHWGIFHQSLFAGFFDRAEGGDVYSDEERWAYTGPLFTDPRTTFTAAQRTSPSWNRSQVIRLSEVGRVENFKQPYVEQATLGLEKTFGGRVKLEALYVRRRNKNMVALVDRNLANNYTVYENVTVLDRFFRPVEFNGQPLVLSKLAVSNEDIIYWRPFLLSGESTSKDYYPPGMPRPQWLALTYEPDIVLTTVPEATRRFDQLQLTGTARYAGWWAQGSVTLTRLAGNLNSITGTDDYTTSGAGPFVRLNEQFNFFGDLNNQSRLEVKLQAGGNLPWGFRGGVFLTTSRAIG